MYISKLRVQSSNLCLLWLICGLSKPPLLTLLETPNTPEVQLATNPKWKVQYQQYQKSKKRLNFFNFHPCGNNVILIWKPLNYFMTEVLIIQKPVQWTGFHMIRTSAIKELIDLYWKSVGWFLYEWTTILKWINPLHATGLFRYLLKTSEDLLFSDVFRRYRKRRQQKNRRKISSDVIMSKNFLLLLLQL